MASLEEFKIQREELMEKMDDLEQELYELDRMHKENVYTLERKQVVDKDRSVGKRTQSFPSNQRHTERCSESNSPQLLHLNIVQ